MKPTSKKRVFTFLVFTLILLIGADREFIPRNATDVFNRGAPE